MQPAEEQYDVGVIVGRFQVHELHAAHRELIEHVRERHEKIFIFLGLSPLSVSTNNPLDFEARKQMLLAEYPEINVLYIKDQYDDVVWSTNLDDMITDLVTPGQTVVLYGGRDSFISHYTGVWETRELTQSTFMSGTAQRKAIARSRVKASAEFRAGVIWASQARFPTAFTTVDIAILKMDETPPVASESWKACQQCTPRDACFAHRDEARRYYAKERPTQILMGRKTNEKLYRFIGGFADPKSPSFEADATRETVEETGLEVGDIKYIGSTVVDDWRYRNEPDGIKTMLFQAKYLHGRPTPGDDIEEVKWFEIPFGGIGPETTSVDPDKKIDWHHINPAHRPLMVMLLNSMKEEQ